MSKCSVTREALSQSGENVCPLCNMISLLHDSEALALEKFRINAEIKKEEMKINAERNKEEINAEIRKEEMRLNAEIKANAEVLPFLHDFVL